jgi:hypothetical protein
MTVFELIEANGLNLHGDIEHFANLVEAAARADEREACAKIADVAEPYKCADLIRARGTT